MKNVKMTEEEAKLIATTLKALSKTFRREKRYNIGMCSVYNVYPEDLSTYADMASRINEAFNYQLF